MYMISLDYGTHCNKMFGWFINIQEAMRWLTNNFKTVIVTSVGPEMSNSNYTTIHGFVEGHFFTISFWIDTKSAEKTFKGQLYIGAISFVDTIEF
jgi:hypothetical protein